MQDSGHPDTALSPVEVGRALPELVKQPTARTLVQFAGASGDFYEAHYDDGFARSIGLPGVIVHGTLKGAYLAQLVTMWLGKRGRLAALDIRYQGIDRPGRPYRCGGVITAITGRMVELDLWGENADGVRTTTGTATVELA